MGIVHDLGVEPVLQCVKCKNEKFILEVNDVGENGNKIIGIECTLCGTAATLLKPIELDYIVLKDK